MRCQRARSLGSQTRSGSRGRRALGERGIGLRDTATSSGSVKSDAIIDLSVLTHPDFIRRFAVHVLSEPQSASRGRCVGLRKCAGECSAALRMPVGRRGGGEEVAEICSRRLQIALISDAGGEVRGVGRGGICRRFAASVELAYQGLTIEKPRIGQVFGWSRSGACGRVLGRSDCRVHAKSMVCDRSVWCRGCSRRVICTREKRRFRGHCSIAILYDIYCLMLLNMVRENGHPGFPGHRFFKWPYS